MRSDRQIGNRGRAGLLLGAAAFAAALLTSIGEGVPASYQVLYSFCAQSGCADGASPEAGLIMDTAGNLYATTASGGGASYKGVVFKLAPDGTETVLHSFCSQSGCPDGANPEAGIMGGAIYSVTTYGGACNKGVVFHLQPLPPPF